MDADRGATGRVGGDGMAARQGVCPSCGTVFQAARSDAVYCSGACRQAAYRRRVTAASSGRAAGTVMRNREEVRHG
jgi:ribosomal protein S27AE